MRRLGAAFAAASFISLFLHHSAYARPITLPEALAAADRGPMLASAAADVDEARGNLEQAGVYTYNPSVAGSAGVARSGGATFFDFELGVSQRIEVGGKRSARKRVATKERDAALQRLEATRNALRAEVRRAFHLAIAAHRRVEVATENERAARQFQEAASERMRLGAATQTDINVAAASLGRAIAQTKRAARDVLLARQALADALGASGADLEPTGGLPTFPAIASEQELVAHALRARRELAAAEHVIAARKSDVELADALAVPDPELSVSIARDAVDNANALIAGVSIDLPLWNRNQGNRSAARARQKRAEIEGQALRAQVERDVRVAARRYRAAVEAVAAFDEQVVGTLAENLQLARDAFAAGKLGLLDLNVIRRDLVESQLVYLDSIAEAIDARTALEVALGRSLEGTP
ncbi:MAG: TolC family protein [Kofleriaceae bacterium]|nr:TolC family protein [Kofleriaceae bacterium]